MIDKIDKIDPEIQRFRDIWEKNFRSKKKKSQNE